MFQKYFKGVLRVKEVSVVIEGCFKNLSRKFQLCIKIISKVVQESFTDVPGVLCFMGTSSPYF